MGTGNANLNNSGVFLRATGNERGERKSRNSHRNMT